MGLRQKRAHVTHPELGVTVQLPIIGVKKNPSSPMYTSLGVLSRGTIIEVNVSELGIVTTSGKVVWGRFAQITSMFMFNRIKSKALILIPQTIPRTMAVSMREFFYSLTFCP